MTTEVLSRPQQPAQPVETPTVDYGASTQELLTTGTPPSVELLEQPRVDLLPAHAGQTPDAPQPAALGVEQLPPEPPYYQGQHRPGQHRAVEHRHRAESGLQRLRRAGRHVLGLVTGRGRNESSSAQAAGTVSAEDTAKPLLYDMPPLWPEEYQPIAPRLEYQAGENQQLKPTGSGKGAANEMYKLGGTVIAANMHKPLLSAEQVSEQLGFDMGALQTVIKLPGAKDPLYVFNRSKTYIAEDGKQENVPSFAFATPAQLGKIRTNLEIGQPSREEIKREILTLTRDPRTTPGNEDVGATIGADKWLPGRPDGPNGYPDVAVPKQYSKVDGRQMRAVIDVQGVLLLRDIDPKRPSVAEVNPGRITPQDPFPGGPSDSYGDVMIHDNLMNSPATKDKLTLVV